MYTKTSEIMYNHDIVFLTHMECNREWGWVGGGRGAEGRRQNTHINNPHIHAEICSEGRKTSCKLLETVITGDGQNVEKPVVNYWKLPLLGMIKMQKKQLETAITGDGQNEEKSCKLLETAITGDGQNVEKNCWKLPLLGMIKRQKKWL